MAGHGLIFIKDVIKHLKAEYGISAVLSRSDVTGYDIDSGLPTKVEKSCSVDYAIVLPAKMFRVPGFAASPFNNSASNDYTKTTVILDSEDVTFAPAITDRLTLDGVAYQIFETWAIVEYKCYVLKVSTTEKQL